MTFSPERGGLLQDEELRILLDVLVSRSPVIAYVIRADGVCTFSAGAPLTRIGLQPGDMVGIDVQAYHGDDDVARDRLTEAIGGRASSYTWSSADGATFETFLEPVLDASGAVASVVGLAIDLTDARRAEAAEHARVLVQQDVLHQLLAVQDAERARISAGLHDDTVQVLAALALRISTLRRRMPGADPAAVAELSAMSRDLSQAGTRLRDVVAGLQPELLVRAGLRTALEDLLDRALEGTVTTTLDTGDDGEPSEHAARVLYEVAVEALGNVRKHAGAATVRVGVRRDGGDWVLEVADDGAGTAAGAAGASGATRSSGFGLRAMRQRAVAAGGTLEVRSEPGAGTTVRLRVPHVAPFAAGSEGADLADVRGPLEHILANVSDAFVALDTSWRYVYVNQRAADLFSTTPGEMVGRDLWSLFPAGRGSDFDQAYQRAMREQVTIEIEEYFAPARRWFRNRILPSTSGLTVFIEDTTERRRMQSREDDTEIGSRVAHTWFVALASHPDPVEAVTAGARSLVGQGLVAGVRADLGGTEVAVGEQAQDADARPAVVGRAEVGRVAVSWPGGPTPWSGELTVMLAQALAARLAPGAPGGPSS